MKTRSAIDAALARATERQIPGVVALVADRQGVIYQGASGLRRVGETQPMTLDTYCWFASMTKAVVAAAAMQLVEQGRLELDAPAARYCPELDTLQVRTGYDAQGRAQLRAPLRPITLRHLLTHTSGLAYETWNADVERELVDSGKPPIISGTRATLQRALVADPGSAWHYGVGLDWAGRVVEAVSGLRLRDYLAQHLFAPLGIRDIGFVASDEQRARAATVHARLPDGSLKPLPFELPRDAELDMGGHGLMGSLPDYLRFLRMILGGGELEGVRVLQASTVAQMGQNQIGALNVPALKAHQLQLSNDCCFHPGIDCKWGLSFLINTRATPEGRAAGSLSWAGLANSYYWIDASSGITAVLLTQILPFYDAPVVALMSEFERAVYAGL